MQTEASLPRLPRWPRSLAADTAVEDKKRKEKMKTKINENDSIQTDKIMHEHVLPAVALARSRPMPPLAGVCNREMTTQRFPTSSAYIVEAYRHVLTEVRAYPEVFVRPVVSSPDIF